MSVGKLSEELVKAGVDVEVFTTTANGATELPLALNQSAMLEGVKVTYFKRITKDHTHLSPALLSALWRNAKQYDVIHIHAWWNLVSVLSALIAFVKRVPVIISPRGTLSAYSFDYKNSGLKKLLHSILGKPLLNSSYIHATSPAEQHSLAKITKPKAFFDIPNFVSLAPSVKQKADDGTVLKLLFFSRIDEKKGLDILLHALPHITKPYHLTIAGNGDESYIDVLKKITHYNGTEKKVNWIGFQHEKKFNVLADHDLMVLPSHNENFGNVVIESLSAGTPVLISNEVGLADYVLNKQLGWICQTNPESIAGTINQIADDRQKLQQISTDAPAIIHADFDDDKLAQRYINMYQQVINKTSKQR